MKNGKKVYWIDLNRFDTKTDKSTWLEMSAAMAKHGYDVTILTGYEKLKYYPKTSKTDIKYFHASSIGGLFRYSLLFKIANWLIRHANKIDIIILPPGGLYIAPLLNLSGKSNIHLDVRTIPVDVYSLRDRIDVLLFWQLTVRFLRRYIKGYSFITNRLRMWVEKDFDTNFKDYVIWHSGVNINLFQPAFDIQVANDKNDFRIFYHGTITENRGILKLAEAVDMLDGEYRDKITLTLIGKGSAYETLIDFVKSNGLDNRILLKGFMPYEDIPNELSKADCCICPLPNYPEWEISSPIKIFEYMACAKPIILTPIAAHFDAVGNSDFVIWTNGYKPNDLSEAIKRAYNNRLALKQSAFEGAEYVKNECTWDIQGMKLAEYFNKTFKISD